MTTTAIRHDSHGSHRFAPRFPRIASTVLHTLIVWQERHNQRRALAELAPEHLRDIGVSAGDAAAEARKPFWRA